MSHLLDTPHLSIPFRLVDGEVVQHEQDTPQDVVQNAVIIMRYSQGDRDAIPEFGIPDPALTEYGDSGEKIVNAVLRWEPQAEVKLVSDLIDNNGTETIKINVGSAGED